MAITGHAKFFKKSKCLEKDGATASASSGNSGASNILNPNTETYWVSSGSNDLTTETIEIEFASALISRILLLDHNFETFDIQYDSSGTWTDFASVVGIGGSLASISESTFSENGAYYEFDSVTTTKIRIRCSTTQVADAEKFLSQVIVTEEYGTLLGWPKIKSTEFDRNIRKIETLSGYLSVQKSLEIPAFDISFEDYPASSDYNADFDLMVSLHLLEVPFLVWLCGGRSGSPYFKYTLRGWRLIDVYQMQVIKPLKFGYMGGVYTNPISTKVSFGAVI